MNGAQLSLSPAGGAARGSLHYSKGSPLSSADNRSPCNRKRSACDRSPSPKPRRPRGPSNASGGSQPTVTTSLPVSPPARPLRIIPEINQASPIFSSTPNRSGEQSSLASDSPPPSPQIPQAAQSAISLQPVSGSVIHQPVVAQTIPVNSPSQPAPPEPTEPQVSRASQDASSTVHTNPLFNTRDKNVIPDFSRWESPFLPNQPKDPHTVIFSDGHAFTTSSLYSRYPTIPVHLQYDLSQHAVKDAFPQDTNSMPGIALCEQIVTLTKTLQIKIKELATAEAKAQEATTMWEKSSQNPYDYYVKLKEKNAVVKILANKIVTARKAEIATIVATINEKVADSTMRIESYIVKNNDRGRNTFSDLSSSDRGIIENGEVWVDAGKTTVDLTENTVPQTPSPHVLRKLNPFRTYLGVSPAC